MQRGVAGHVGGHPGLRLGDARLQGDHLRDAGAGTVEQQVGVEDRIELAGVERVAPAQGLHSVQAQSRQHSQCEAHSGVLIPDAPHQRDRIGVPDQMRLLVRAAAAVHDGRELLVLAERATFSTIPNREYSLEHLHAGADHHGGVLLEEDQLPSPLSHAVVDEDLGVGHGLLRLLGPGLVEGVGYPVEKLPGVGELVAHVQQGHELRLLAVGSHHGDTELALRDGQKLGERQPDAVLHGRHRLGQRAVELVDEGLELRVLADLPQGGVHEPFRQLRGIGDPEEGGGIVGQESGRRGTLRQHRAGEAHHHHRGGQRPPHPPAPRQGKSPSHHWAPLTGYVQALPGMPPRRVIRGQPAHIGEAQGIEPPIAGKTVDYKGWHGQTRVAWPNSGGHVAVFSGFEWQRVGCPSLVGSMFWVARP